MSTTRIGLNQLPEEVEAFFTRGVKEIAALRGQVDYLREKIDRLENSAITRDEAKEAAQESLMDSLRRAAITG